jgi:hypothetical protein
MSSRPRPRCSICSTWRFTFIRRTASSAGLLATSFGGHHHFKDLSTHPLTDLFLFWVMMMMSLFVLAETKWESFLFCIRDFRVRCFCTPYLWERTGSVCIIHLYSVFDPCVPLIWRALRGPSDLPSVSPCPRYQYKIGAIDL